MFFTLYQEGVKREASHFRELLDISAVPKMNLEYYKELRNRYNKYIYKNKPKLPTKPSDMMIDAASDEAREVVFSLFRGMKRGMGYV